MSEYPLEVTRRDLMKTGATALVPALGKAAEHGAGGRMRLALVGAGQRGASHWGRAIVSAYADVVELVGLCDINRKRAEAARSLLSLHLPTFVDFDRMVQSTKPDTVLIATPDATHWRYVVRGMELDCHVITEKALCTDEEQCQAILDNQKRLGKPVTVTFNARHFAEAKKIKQFMQEKAIGDVISVTYHEYLNTDHGASYFRRWHRLRQMNGTLLVTKSCHHFDQVNWWLETHPVEVTASGRLRFYGRNNSFRSSHCRVCPFQKTCSFHWDITKDDLAMKMYVACESEDGYLRDGCVWREDTNIYDTSSVRVKYENGATLTYTTDAYLPFEGQAIVLNGTKGRIDWNSYYGGGFRNQELRLTRSFGRSEAIAGLQQREGGHGGADRSLMDLIFRNRPADDSLDLRAGLREGALAALVGIAAYRSIDRGGESVRIADLMRF